MPPRPAFSSKSSESIDGDKIHEIRSACEKRDVDALRDLAASEGGLLEDKARREAWPLLLACDLEEQDAGLDFKKLPKHRDEDQVELDVNRSFVYYPEDESEKEKEAHKVELSQVIVTVLRRHPVLHYFQGYHDIVQVLLLVLGVNAAIAAVSRLSLLRIRDFMLPTMAGTEPHLQLLPAILHAADPTLAGHLSQCQPFFALPATLTLYAHEIEEYGSIARLFDFLLASEAAVSVYLFAVVVISRKDKLLEIEADEPEMLHSVLSKLPKPLDLDGLIRQTKELYQRYPPERLPGRIWSRVSSSSVLKTTRDFQGLSKQSLHDGERFFDKEATEIRRHDSLIRKQQQLKSLARRYRRPAVFTSTAVLFAVVAFFLRSSNLAAANPGWRAAFLGLQQRVVEIWQRF